MAGGGGEGEEGVFKADYAESARYYSEAAEAAEAALKPKLSMKYFDLAATAEGMMEAGDEDEK
jgi:hypothetical protein